MSQPEKTSYVFTKSRVSNGRPRLESGAMIAVLSPNGRKWELYTRGSDGLEIFGRYATEIEAEVLSAARKDRRDCPIVGVSFA